MEDGNMKKSYQKPAMQVVLLRQRTHILSGSSGQGAKSLSNTEYFEMKDGGFDNNEEDM